MPQRNREIKRVRWSHWLPSLHYQLHWLLVTVHAADRVHRLQHTSDRGCCRGAPVEPLVQRGGEHNPNDRGLQREDSWHIRKVAKQGHLLLPATSSLLHGMPGPLDPQSLLKILVELSGRTIAREKHIWSRINGKLAHLESLQCFSNHYYLYLTYTPRNE